MLGVLGRNLGSVLVGLAREVLLALLAVHVTHEDKGATEIGRQLDCLFQLFERLIAGTEGAIGSRHLDQILGPFLLRNRTRLVTGPQHCGLETRQGSLPSALGCLPTPESSPGGRLVRCQGDCSLGMPARFINTPHGEQRLRPVLMDRRIVRCQSPCILEALGGRLGLTSS